MYIPDIGDKITLVEDWELKLYTERRNYGLLQAFGYTPSHEYIDNDYKKGLNHHLVTLPKGVTLTVDRVYIRKGSAVTAGYSSVTFVIDPKSNDKEFQKYRSRFWAKLEDCNTIQFELASQSKRTERVVLPSAWNIEMRSVVYANYKNHQNKEVNDYVNIEYLFKNGKWYNGNERVELDNNFYPIHQMVKISDQNLKSNIKDVELKIEYKRTMISFASAGSPRKGIFGTAQIISYQAMFKTKYVLYDNNDILIGEYGTVQTLLKNAKTFLEKIKNESEYKVVTSIKDLY